MEDEEEGRVETVHSAPYSYAPVRGSHRLGPPPLPGQWPELDELRNEVRSLRAELDELRAAWRYWLPFFNQLYRWIRDMVRWWHAP